MTTSPVVPVTDELIAEFESVAHSNDADCMEVHGISVGIVRALLAERAELKRDAERYRWIRDQGFVTIKPERGELTLFTVRSQHVEADSLDSAIDAAMQS